MSDYGDDYNENEYVDYDKEYEDNVEENINLDDMILEANSCKDVEKYKEIIELEKGSSSTRHYAFQCYDKMCIIYLENKNLKEFSDSFTKLISLYPKVEYSYKMETMRDMNMALTYINDVDFLSEICRIIIDILYESRNVDKSIERELLNTGILFCKSLVRREKVDMLGEMLDEMFDIMDRLNIESDESLKNSKLEFIVLKIQFCNYKGLTNEAKKLYFEAESLNKEKTSFDNTLSSIINEQGGKLYMSQRNYEKAFLKFKEGFYNFQESGNHEKAKIMLKYSILNSIIVRNNKSVISQDETKIYEKDSELSALLELKNAYDSANINQINDLWNNKIKAIERDEFIINQLNEILHEIRFNYIKMKLSAYKVCKFDTLRLELGVDQDYLTSILLEMVNTDFRSIRINFTNSTVQVVDNNNLSTDSIYNNISKWINKLNN